VRRSVLVVRRDRARALAKESSFCCPLKKDEAGHTLGLDLGERSVDHAQQRAASDALTSLLASVVA